MIELYRYDGDCHWPRVSPDAQNVVFGGGGIPTLGVPPMIRAVHLPVLKTVSDAPHWFFGTGRHGRFLQSDTVQFTREDPGGGATRFLASLVDGRIMPTRDAADLVEGNLVEASGTGHWASWRERDRRLVYDGQVLSTQAYGVTLAGEYLATVEGIDTPQQRVSLFRAGRLITTAPVPQGANELVVSDAGWIGYGYFWDAQFLEPGGKSVDVTITPWRKETPPLLVQATGPWVWTASERPSDSLPLVIGRPLGGRKAVVLEGVQANYLSVAYDRRKGGFVVAAASNTGRLRVFFVAESAPLTEVVDVAPVLVTPIAPVYPQPTELAWYYADGRYGSFRPKQNTIVLALEHYSQDGAIPADAPERYRTAIRDTGNAYIGESDESILKAAPFWQYVAGIALDEYDSPAAMNDAVARAKDRIRRNQLPMRRIVATLMPAQALDRQYQSVTADRLAVELYFDPPGPATWEGMLTLFEERVRQVEWALAGRELVAIVQAYTRGNQWTNANTLQAIQFAANRLPLTPSIWKGLWRFAYARPNGAREHRYLEPWHDVAVERNPGRPGEEDDVNPPGVNIRRFDPVLRDGQPWRLEVDDRNNAGVGVIVERRANGSIHVTLKNPKGSDTSGATRIVSIG